MSYTASERQPNSNRNLSKSSRKPPPASDFANAAGRSAGEVEANIAFSSGFAHTVRLRPHSACVASTDRVRKPCRHWYDSVVSVGSITES